VRDESKPAGSVERLCKDAAFAAATVPESSPPGTQPGVEGVPPPPRPMTPTTSGGSYNGPISQ
ncbi:MAG TPA: hypothetical protein VGL86_18695, partial [Polyangia bacterium]|jgi:hypothetical protein